MTNINNNKKIAKNTVLLYIRTLVVLAMSLYTSRLVLQVLGVEDMGIYNVVGGIVALMSFFQSAQTKSTSRFITFELGKGSSDSQLKKVFSQCMTIHIMLAMVVVVIGETLGLYIVNHWTNIPAERWLAMQYVYQFAILTFCIHVIRIPYDSVIVAHEDMSIYAYMSIIEASLQLIMVITLFRFTADKLIVYSGLLCGIALVLFLLYRFYVVRKRPVYRFSWLWDKDNSAKILSFSGWTLLGSGANTATQQGVSLLFNNFIGLVANTALGFANQVNGAVGRFVGSFTAAFNPQIVKLYADGDYGNMHLLMDRAAKISFSLCYVMALPLILNMGFVLKLWLGNVPPLTAGFCSLILVCSVIDATTGVLNTAITATGKIKGYEIGISISFLLDLACATVLLLCKVSPIIVFASRIVTRGIINMFIGLYFAKKQLNYGFSRFFTTVLYPSAITCIVTLCPCLLLPKCMSGWKLLLVSAATSVLLVGICVWCIILNKNERRAIFNSIHLKYGK